MTFAGPSIPSPQEFSIIAQLGCAVCRRIGYPGTPAEIHIIEEGGGKVKKKNALHDAIPMCPQCHRGATGLHGLGKLKFKAHWGFDEADLLADTKALVKEAARMTKTVAAKNRISASGAVRKLRTKL